MMDCSAASGLIMKYLDGEATDFESKLLFEHLDGCKSCHLEFKALSDTLSMLGSVKMDEPPENMEESVLTRITAEDRSRGKARLYIMAAAFASSGWGVLMGIFKYTPLPKILGDSLWSIFYFIKDLAPIIGRVLYDGLSGILKFFTIERAVGRAAEAIMWSYSPALLVMIILMALVLLLYDYMLN